MEDLHAIIKDLQSSVQVFAKKYNNLKKENESLRNQNDVIEKQLSEKNALINSAEEKIATNNMGAIFNLEEKKLLQSKINSYLKDIEKCLSLLNA